MKSKFKSKKKDVVAVISGGLDSTTMIWYLKNIGYNIKEAITFNYGQRHDKEIKFSSKIIKVFNQQFGDVNHHVVDISSIGSLIAKGSITGKEETPIGMYDSDNQRKTIVPNRNMIFLSIAAGRAVTIGANFVGYAAHASDYSVYPDCRPEFIDQLDKALYLGNLWSPVNIIAPFKNMTKSEIVKEGIKLDVPLELTWSCYEGIDRPCLKCGTCIERTEAFKLNNETDPTLSLDEWETALELYNNLEN